MQTRANTHSGSINSWPRTEIVFSSSESEQHSGFGVVILFCGGGLVVNLLIYLLIRVIFCRAIARTKPTRQIGSLLIKLLWDLLSASSTVGVD